MTAPDIPVCVRPTGGGLVRHGSDLIYSVLARRDSFPTFGMVRTSYLSFHEAVQDAFRSLGFETRLLRCDEVRDRHCATTFHLSLRALVSLRGGNPGGRRGGPRCPPEYGLRADTEVGPYTRGHGALAMADCFKEPVATDVLLEERKVAGGGQWRRRDGFLHQGSVRLTCGMTYEGLRDALRGAWERKFDGRDRPPP